MPRNRWLIAFVLYMALLGGNYMLVNLVFPLRVLHQLLITGLLVYWFWRHGLPKSPMLLPVAGMAAATLITIPSSVDPRMAFENAWAWLTNLGLFLLVTDWARRGYGGQLINAQLLAGGLLVMSCLAQWMFMPGMRVQGLFLLTNLTGAYSAALLIPALVWARSAKSRLQGLITGALAVGLILTLLANQSRGALVSVAVAWVAYQLLSKRFWRIAIGLIPLAFALSWATLPGHQTGDVLRLDLWRGGERMLADHPAGVGVGLFGQVYRKEGDIRGEDGLLGAHNLYINLAAETGWPGLLASGSLALVYLYHVASTPMDSRKKAVLAALVGILAHMLVDTYEAQNWAFLVGIYAAYLVGEQEQKLPFAHWLSRGAALLVLVYSLPFIQFDHAQVYYEQSLGGDVRAAQVAAGLDPSLRLYQLNLAELAGDQEAAQRIDYTLTPQTDRLKYALVNFARRWR